MPSRTKKRSDGLYQRSITVGRKPDGGPKRKIIYARTLKELDQKASEYERQLLHGTLSSNEKLAFGELAGIWIDEYKPQIRDTTKSMYRSILTNHLLPDLAGFKLKDLKAYHLQRIVNRLAEKGRSESVLKKVKLTAVQILQVALDNDVIHRNVFVKVTVPSIPAKRRRPLTEAEVRLINQTYADHRMGVPAMILLYCGLRRGELVALTWSDVDIRQKLIHVNKSVIYVENTPRIKEPKSKAGIRSIPIPDSIIGILKQARKSADSTMVCPAADGGIMSQTAFARAWESYLHYLNIQAGGYVASRTKPKLVVVERVTPHMFRHTYATILYNAGVDVKSAQRFLGHADINVTLRIYTHLSARKEREAIDILNKHLSDSAYGKI